MNLRELNVLVVDDNIFKAIDIKKALEFNGISKIKVVHNQAEVWDLLGSEEHFGLIVTDMHYPLERGMEADHNAGFILIEKMKEKDIKIPVIICSTRNFTSPDVIGTVWYNPLTNIEFAFKEVLEKL